MTNLIQSFSNIIPDEICNKLIAFTNQSNSIASFDVSRNVQEWSYYINIKDIKDDSILNVLKYYALTLNEIIKKTYNESNLFVNFGALVKWIKGNKMILHTDNGNGEDNTTKILFMRKYSAIIYLNDNFSGGFTYFDETNNNYENKPKKGSALVFSSDERCRHGVTEVISGERFTYGLWFTDAEKYKSPTYYT